MSEKNEHSFWLTESDKVYTYYAFISYKHRDKKWAKWVQKQLEHYRLPNRLCRQNRTPKHVTPIFRDETDLTGGKTVYDLLDEKIRQSKFLIVICSRNMQIEPKYIDYEIENFLAAGNPASRILPVIVDGEANSADPAKECLPPALKRMGANMPLGITVIPRKEKEAVLKLIACILELDLQSLRSHNHERNQRRLMAAMGCGLAFSLGVGALMAWEVLSVTQASLREQLTYAADTFRQGDKLSTTRIASGVAQRHNVLMEKDILSEAERLERISSIHPKYQPLTKLCQVTADSRLLFDTSGEHALVITDNAVKKYNMQGEQVMAFDISQTAHQIVDVCPDGVHAVIMSIYQFELEGTHLWLWNMETDTPVCHLTESMAYEDAQQKVGYLGGVVDARFSPDGSMVCAYQDASGFFNHNQELAAWDVKTGEKLFSYPGQLLGSSKQGPEVEAFEFIGNHTLHWTGTDNHVYYTLGDAEPIVISKRAMPAKRDRDTYSVAHLRYTIGLAEDGNGFQITDLATGCTMQCRATSEESFYEECGERYLLIVDEVVDDRGRYALQEMHLIDLQNLCEAEYMAAFNELCRGQSIENMQFVAQKDALYVGIGNNALYRLNLADGSFFEVKALYAQDYQLLACTESMEVLAATRNDALHLLEVEGEAVRHYTLNGEMAQFAASAAFAFKGEAAYMAAENNGSYYLYPIANPGQQLDGDLDMGGQAMYASSPDGQLVLKAADRAFAIWQGDTLLSHTQLGEKIQGIGAAEESFFVLTGSDLSLYNGQGEKIGAVQAAKNRQFLSAKIAADGKRIALLMGIDSLFAENAYELVLLDGATLSQVERVSDQVYVAPSSAYEVAYDLSPDGKWLSAVLRIWDGNHEHFQLSAGVWATGDGNLAAVTQNSYSAGKRQFDLLSHPTGVASAYRMQYVKFARDGKLLSGLQYGTWIFDVERVETVAFLSEGSSADALQELLHNGQLLYPANGLHVWDITTGRMERTLAHRVGATDVNALLSGESVNAMLDEENQERLYVSGDEQWLAFTGEDNTWLYNTRDWETNMLLVPQPARVLHLDETCLVYATPEGLWRLSFLMDE